MRVYIIGNDGITLCREPPATVNEGEIAVASSEELHAARLSGKRLLALWNALPGVEKRRKVADRAALIEQLWSAIEMLPDPQSEAKRPSKQDEVIAMLRRPQGAMRVSARRARRRSPCVLVMVTVVRPAWLVCRPIACSSSGRLVIASR